MDLRIRNNWLPHSEFYNSDYYDFKGIGYQVLHKTTNTVYNIFFCHDENESLTRVYETEVDIGVDIPTEECLFRFNNDQFHSLMKIFNKINVGDLVKIKAGRYADTNWRKIKKIDVRTMTFDGICFEHPGPGGSTGHNSKTKILNVIQTHAEAVAEALI